VLALVLGGIVLVLGTPRAPVVRLTHASTAGYLSSVPYYSVPETYGGTNPVETCSGCDFWGSTTSGIETGFSTNPNDMVNPSDGDMSDSDTLFSVPDIGGDMSMTLSYDSLYAQAYTAQVDAGAPHIAAAYGYGWNSQTSARWVGQITEIGVTEYEDDAVILPSGAVETFYYNDSGNASDCPAGTGLVNATAPGSSQDFCAAPWVDATWGEYSAYGAYELFEHGGLQNITYTAEGSNNIIYQGGLHNTGDVTYLANESPHENGCPATFPSTSGMTLTDCTVVSDADDRYYVVPLDSEGAAMGIQDPALTDWEFNYNSVASPTNLTSIVDPLENTWSFSYDSSDANPNYVNDLISLTDPDNNETTITYTPYGSDPCDGVIVPISCEEDEVTAVKDAESNITSFSGWVPEGQIDPGYSSYATTIVNPDGATVTDGFTLLQEVSQGITGSNASYNTNTYYSYTGTATYPTEQITDAMGIHTDLGTDPYGDVLTSANSYGTTTTAYIGGTGDPCWSALPEVTVPSGEPTCSDPPAQGSGASFYYYDTLGDQIESIDPDGNITYTQYDSNGFPCWQSIPGASVPNPTAACSSPPADADTFSYNVGGDLMSESTPDGQGGTFTYDKTTYQYNNYGEATSTVSPDGYEAGNTPASYTTTDNYYSNGVLYQVVAPLGRTTTAVLNKDNEPTSVTDPYGLVTTTAYDLDNRTCWVYQGTAPSACLTIPTGSTAYSYFANTDDPQAVADPNGKITYTVYGDQSDPNEPTEVVDPLLNYTTNVYDADGFLCLSGTGSAALPLSEQGNSLTTDCVARSGYTLDTYDQLGNVVTTTDPSGNTTGYSRNDQYPSEVTEDVPPPNGSQGSTSYSYDPDGRLRQQIEQNGTVITTDYTPSGQECWTAPSDLMSSTCSTTLPSEPGAASWSYYYSQLPHVMQTVGSSGTATDATYTYDDQGQEISDLTNAGTVGYTYDAAGDNTCVAYPVSASSSCLSPASSTNTVVNYGFNADGQMTNMTDWLGNEFGFGYDARSNLNTIDYPTASTWSESMLYGAANNQISNNITSSTYGTVSTANTPNADELYSTIGSTSYNYNSQVRLATAGTQTFGYNPNGTISSVATTGSPTLSFTYNGGASPNQSELSTVDIGSTPVSYQYDEEGNRCGAVASSSAPSCITVSSLPSTEYTYGYNDYNELCWSGAGGTGSGQGTCGSPPTGSTGSPTYTYSYDGDGLRTSETTNTGTSSTQNFAYDTQTRSGQPLIIMDGTNAYLYGPANYGGGTAPLEQISLSGHTASYLFSGATGVRYVATSAGAITSADVYSAYGTRTTGGVANATPFGFEGAYTDPTTFLYLIDRYYDPSTSQFLSVDPDVAATGQPYAYTGDDPVNGTDPLGIIASNQFGEGCGATIHDCQESTAQENSECPGSDPDCGSNPSSNPPVGTIGTIGQTISSVSQANAVGNPQGSASSFLGALAGAVTDLPIMGQDAFYVYPVVRGGTCTSAQFDEQPTNAQGKLTDLSVQYMPGITNLRTLTSGYLKNGQVGVTQDIDVFADGGSLTLDPTILPYVNPYHALLSGITPAQACALFNPTISNPGK
jgi:RHS repeat-associated protein